MGTRHNGTIGEKKALNAYIKLMRAAGRVTADTHRHLAEFKITVSQLGVLDALYHLGPLYQKEIAAKILKSAGNLTTVIDNLEKRGLVKRRRETDDRRLLMVSLTEDGRRLFADIFPRHVAGIVDRFAALSAGEQVQFALLCRKLGLGRP